MAERVVIKIDVKADVRSIRRVQAELLKLKATSEALEDKFDRLTGSISGTNEELDLFSVRANKASQSAKTFGKQSNQASTGVSKMQRHLNSTNRSMGRFDSSLNKVGKKLQGLIKFTMKALLLNIIGVGAALLTVSGAFTVANAAVKVWNASLIAASVAGASLIAVLAGLAAGQREYAAALNAVQYGGMAKGTAAAMTQLRGLQSNAQLAVLGAEAVQGAFAAISASTPVTGALNTALTKLGDFAAGSADPTKALTGAGSFLGLLVKEGKLTEAVLEAAAEVGPAFQKALEEGAANGLGKTSDEILKSIISGKYSGAYEGQLENINNTLFGTVKKNFELIKSSFADLGQNFLPEFTVAIEKMSRSLQTGLTMISGSVSGFAKGPFVDTLVNGFDRLVKGGANLFNRYLPKAEGAVKTISGWVDKIRDGFGDVVTALRPLLDGAQVLKDAFGPVFKSLFTEFAGGVKGLDELLTANKDEFMAFGASVDSLFKSFGDLFGELKTALVQVIPVLTSIADVFTDIVGAVTEVFKGLNSLGKAGSWVAIASAFLGYGALGKLGITGNKGLVGRGAMAAAGAVGGASATAAMTVSAGVVYVNGPIGTGVAPSSGDPLVGGSGPGAAKRPGRFTRAMGSSAGQMAGILAATYGIHSMTTAGDTRGAAVGGAVAGAGIGTMIAPGVGTLVGAGLGAAGGAIYGETIGRAGRNKNAARASATQRTAVASGILGDAINAGDYNTASSIYNDYLAKNTKVTEILTGSQGDTNFEGKAKAFEELTSMGYGASEANDMIAASSTYIDELKAQEKELSGVVAPAIANYNANIQRLGEVTGMSASEIEGLAAVLGDDLGGAIQDVGAYISEILGVDIPKNYEEQMAARNDAIFTALDAATLPLIQQQEASLAVDQGAQLVKELLYMGGGKMDEAEYAKFVRDAFNFEYAQTYDKETGQYDSLKAMENLSKTLGVGGEAYMTGNVFAGLEDMLAPTFEKLVGGIGTDGKDTYTRQLLGMLAERVYTETGGRESIDVSKITAEDIAGMTEQSIRRLERLIEAPLPTTGFEKSYGPEVDVAGINSELEMIGVGSASLTTAGADISSGAAEMSSSAGAMKAAGSRLTGSASALTSAASAISTAAGGMAISGFYSFPGMPGVTTNTGTGTGWGGGGPGPKQDPVIPKGVSDTPTSRLQSTLAKHSRLDSSISGKRNITSTIRGTNLGSLASDHLTGDAYDIVGQNLGSYAQSMKSMGGFAEFHGRGEERHLHVVPGQGDTMSPAAMPVTPPAAVSGGDTFSIQVIGSPGMDVKALAYEVHRQIAAAQRSARERATVG